MPTITDEAIAISCGLCLACLDTSVTDAWRNFLNQLENRKSFHREFWVLLLCMTPSQGTSESHRLVRKVFDVWHECIVEKFEEKRKKDSLEKVLLLCMTPSQGTSESHRLVRKVFDVWHKCIVEKFEEKREKDSLEKLWIDFANITEVCSVRSKVSNIKLTPFANSDETKYYVFSDIPEDFEPSVVVSLGIGADDTEFFGADPVYSPNAELFSKVGTFFPLAVSEKTGLVRSGLRNDDGANSGSYREVDAVSIDLLTFLQDMVNRTVIDHLIMDNEGPEFDLLPMVAVDNVLQENGITICQMNVEVTSQILRVRIHAPGPQERLEYFASMMSDVLKAKRFAPIYNLYWGHQRAFFVNFEHPLCVEKYLTKLLMFSGPRVIFDLQ
ncbi:unnamed protein product [Cylicostephanus goldi]|uniref:Methyltransferase FkbM domain-containing protein n=1 Tax=Cylicostephanus goldi TaxID=71465 RepID=A0A3P7PM26_CYLGO|nr:unnamed protein product [Cylicostephanus goldi]